MQKWEYLYTQAQGSTVIEINGKSVNRENMPDYLRRAGMEGWELVGLVTASESGISWRLIFKRALNLP
jgi:hypothetical protein